MSCSNTFRSTMISSMIVAGTLVKNTINKLDMWKCRFNDSPYLIELPVKEENKIIMKKIYVYNEPLLYVFFKNGSAYNDYDDFMEFVEKMCPEKSSRYTHGYRIYCMDESIYSMIIYEGELADSEFAFEIITTATTDLTTANTSTDLEESPLIIT